MNDGASAVDWTLGLDIPGGSIAAAILFLALFAVAVLGVRELGEPAGRRRGVLIGLRVLTVTIAGLAAIQPVWLGERLAHREGRLAVLVDVSRSMMVTAGDRSRAEVAAGLLERWEGDPAAQGAEVYSFGEELEASSFAAAAEGGVPVDDDTRTADAIMALVEGDARGDLGAVVVVGDGADRGDALPPHLLERIRIHSVAVGADAAFRDDSLASIEADPVGFLRQPTKVRVRVRSLGGSGRPIPVQLREGDQVMREVIAEPDEHGEAEVEIELTPERLGRNVYRVTIPVDPDDAVPENNDRAFLVRVGRDKLRVLLVAGQPSWDERYLRRFLKDDPAIDLISFFILRTAADLTMAASDELALIPFPTDELFSEHLGSFDLVIFQNFEYGPYQMAGYLPRIRDYVRRGGAFAMVGGDLSFGSGGYAATPIADILPVTMPPQDAPESQRVIPGRFSPQLVADLVRHPLLELLPDPSANAAAWAALAPLEGANRLTGVRDEGLTLLTHPTARVGGAPAPVLVVGEAHDGRVLALATDTTWRWGITTGGLRGDSSAFERFWDRTLRWLTRDPTLEPARISTERERYGPGASIRVEAILRDARYQPLADRTVRLAVVDAMAREVAGTNVVVDGRGRASATLEAPAMAGAYRVVARNEEGEDLCDESFVLEAGGDELADPRPRPDLLAALSSSSSGTHYTAEDAPSLDQLDATRTRSLGFERFAPFASVPFILLSIALLTAEWIVRRRWGQR